MSHVIVPNFTPTAVTRSTDSIWILTRAMKKAGWSVQASSAGNGATSPSNFRYTGGAYLATISSVTDATLTPPTATANGTVIAFSTPLVTFSAPSASFTASDVGAYVTISGAAQAGNNGVFIITAVNSATSITYSNTSGVLVDANNGTISWKLYSDTCTLSTPTGTFTQKDVGSFVEVSGANSANNNGRFVIVRYLSATSVRILNAAAVAGDSNNGSISSTLRPRTVFSSEDAWQIGASLGSGAAGALSGVGLTPDRMILTGLSGLTYQNVGDWLVLSGASTAVNNGTWQIVRVISGTSCEVLAKNNASPYTGTIAWTLRQGTGASVGNNTGANVSTKPYSGDDDFIVTGLTYTTVFSSGAAGAVGVAPTYNTVEVNNLTGITPADVGRWITITLAANAGNNGTFLIVKYISATSVRILNANRVASDANAVTWEIKKGPEEGNFLCLTSSSFNFNNGSFQITKTLGPASCWVRIPNGTQTDAGVSWVEKDPTAESLSNIDQWGQGGWILMQGPSFLKIPFTTGIAAASAFLPGEKVTQAATGGEGELVGITVDSSGTGWLVVLPQVKGTGTAYDFGWDLTAVVGSSSTAQITPTNIQEFQKEVQFYIVNDANWTKGGYCMVTCTRKDTELDNQLFLRALHTNCTNVKAPGYHNGASSFIDNGPNSSTLPYQAYAPWGLTFSGGAGTPGSYDFWSRHGYDPATNNIGKSQISCANCLRRGGQSADGTFTLYQYNTTAAASGGFSYQRMDNQEEGDVDPYWFYAHSGGSTSLMMWTPVRSGWNGTTAFNVFTTFGPMSNSNTGSSRGGFMTRSRGVGYKEIQGCAGNGAVQMFQVSDGGLTASTGGYPTTWYQASSDPQYVGSSATNDKRILEKITVVALPGTGSKFIKGTCRWLYHATQMGSNVLDTYGDKQWVVGASGALTYFSQPLVFGPWDGKPSPII